MNWRNVVTDKWAGPHVDQSFRDLLDDHGLVPIDGVAVGAATHRMEVAR